MYAIIEKGGHQYRVAPGDTLRVQKLEADNGGHEVSLDRVLLLATEEGTLIGTPFVRGAMVKAEVLRDEKGDKVMIFKKKPRKGHKKLRGHRQLHTVLKITDIVQGG